MKFLEQLILTNGVSGNEGEIRAMLKKEIKPYVDRITTDKMGNLICVKNGKGPRVMLAAHMDEIGLITKSIKPSGQIYLSELGGLVIDSLVGQRVQVRGKKKDIIGIITTKNMSNDEPFDEEHILQLADLFIDTGMSKKELNRQGVMVGTPIALLQESGYLANKKTMFGKALDDRIGCYALVETAKKVKSLRNEIAFVFTVQEEVGLYGAKTAAFSVDPDWGIAVDVGNADDCLNDSATRVLGNGPTLTIKDSELIASRELNEIILKAAKKNRIPVQREVSDSGTTDALSISLSREGVPSTVIGVPVRNIHTTIGIASVSDIKNLVKLLTVSLKALSKKS